MTRALDRMTLTSASHCWRFLALHQVFLSLSGAIIVALGYAGGIGLAVLGAVGSALVVTILTFIRRVRRAVDREIRAAARRERAVERATLIERGDTAHRAELDELNGLVGDIERAYGEDHARDLELERLLDLYVDYVVANDRYRNAARRALTVVEPSTGEGSPAAFTRDEIMRRRISHREECERRALELEAALSAITQFVRLLAERALCPAELPAVDGELEWRLWEIDAREAAVHQLTAP